MQSFEAIQARRDASVWTRIHPVFAVGQLGVFLVSLGLLGLYFFHAVPFAAVYVSVLIKIAFMVGAVITGSLWEHDVYGKWWFAPEFFIEDVMTANVFFLHAGVLATVFLAPANMRAILAMLMLAYLVYGLNVFQYIVRHLAGVREAATRRPADAEAAA